MASRIGVGIIGAGSMGARHAENLARHIPEAKISAVMDVDQARAETVARACGGAKIFDDPLALIRDPAVDALVIASPDASHAALAIACADAGKPTLCEKPLACDLDGAASVVQAEVDSGRRLIQLGFMRVYDGAHRQVKALVEQGRIGRTIMMRAVHDNCSPGYERTVADVITNSAVHDFHSARWLVSDEVNQVFARHVPAAVDRATSCRLALVDLMFCGGAIASIEVNAASGHGYQVRVELVGEAGAVTMANEPAPVVLQAGEQRSAMPLDWLTRFEGAYRLEARAWIDGVIARQPSGPSAWDGYASLAIADAGLRSIASGMPEAVITAERPLLYRS